VFNQKLNSVEVCGHRSFLIGFDIQIDYLVPLLDCAIEKSAVSWWKRPCRILSSSCMTIQVRLSEIAGKKGDSE